MSDIMPQTTLDVIEKTQEYLDDIKDHVLNVRKAWEDVKVKCKDMRFICDDFYYFSIENSIDYHDVSRLSEQEFIQCRKAFYPAKNEPRFDTSEAWEHHKQHNPHHWENWTKIKPGIDAGWEVHCAHMVVDWIAMGYQFGGTARCYYEKNKEKIDIPSYAIDFINQIFDRVYGKCKSA
ncbi:MAG: hypothetical protein KJP07_13645 [Desulfatitalea sp.]|nr:hypothetical protein [Desulfatitalea sp.]